MLGRAEWWACTSERELASRRLGNFLGRKTNFDYEELESLLKSSSYGKTSVLEALIAHPAYLFNEPMSAKKTRFDDSFSALNYLRSKGLVDAKFYNSFIAGASKSVPLEILSAVMNSHSLEEIDNQTRDRLLNEAAQKSPEQFLDLVSSNQEALGGVDVRTAFYEVLGADSWNAINWVDTNQGSLTPIQIDQISQAIGLYSRSKGEFDTAWEWQGKISNPELRKEAEGRIWEAERSEVVRRADADPEAVIDSITSGKSIHAEYWIEEAFRYWEMNAPDNAAVWYEENRTTLTPTQNQYIARVYAEEAIDNGDLDSARRWTSQLKEQRLIDEMNAKIERSSLPTE